MFNIKEKIRCKTIIKIGIVFLFVFIFVLSICKFYNYLVKEYLYPIKYKESVVKYSNDYGFEPLLIFSIVKVESDFNKNAQSQKGAVGLMQITEKTAKYIAEKLDIIYYDLKDENTNLKFGCYYLRYLCAKFNCLETAIVAYNAGEGNVSRWLGMGEYSTDKITLNYIPFKESREYIEKINKTFAKYKNLYKNFLDK